MPCKFFVVSLIYCLIIFFVHGSSANYPNGKTRFCGKRLITALEKLCTNGYWGQKVDQRPTDSPYEYYAYQMRTTLAGIVSQCCLEPCSYEYLKSFCVPDDIKMAEPSKATAREQPVVELPPSNDDGSVEPVAEPIADF